MSVRVFIDRKEMTGFTDLRLTRTKKAATGQLSLSIFMNYMPNEPVMEEVQRDQEILVYVGNQLAFTGKIDRRVDTGDMSGAQGTQRSPIPGGSVSIGPNQYTLRFECRGKARAIVDNSHKDVPSTVLKTSAKSLFEKLVEPFQMGLEWLAEDVELDRWRFRDGARVVDELNRLAESLGLYFYETRDGKLKVVDRQEDETGEAIVLGTNILSFNTTQAADSERKKVVVKGHKNKKEDWGEAACIVPARIKEKIDEGVLAVEDLSNLTVPYYGDATQENMQRRVDHEVNKRAQRSKKIKLDVFHVLQTDGTPWDIGKIHYVEIPPAGVFGQFEVTELVYTVNNDKTLKTSLTLAPVTTKTPVEGALSGLLSGLPANLDEALSGATGAVNLSGFGALASSWSAPALANPIAKVEEAVDQFLSNLEIDEVGPPLIIDEPDSRNLR